MSISIATMDNNMKVSQKLKLLYDPRSTASEYIFKGNEISIFKDVCTPMFIVVLFAIVKI
jgi:hypothetical protein